MMDLLKMASYGVSFSENRPHLRRVSCGCFPPKALSEAILSRSSDFGGAGDLGGGCFPSKVLSKGVSLFLGVVVGLLIGWTPLWAAEYRSSLESGSSAYSVSQGGVEGFTPYASVVFESSAGIARAGTGFSGYYASQAGGESLYSTVAFSGRVYKGLSLAFGRAQEQVTGLHTTELDGSEEIVSSGSFDYSNSEYVLGSSILLSKRSSIGISYHYYHQVIDSIEGTGGDMSIGYVYRSNRFGLLLNTKNILGGSVSYTQGKSSPLLREAYASLSLDRRIASLRVQYKWVEGVYNPFLSYGVSFRPIGQWISFNAGLRSMRKLGDQVDTVMTAGISLKLSIVHMDYAFQLTDYVASPDLHSFSVGLKF